MAAALGGGSGPVNPQESRPRDGAPTSTSWTGFSYRGGRAYPISEPRLSFLRETPIRWGPADEVAARTFGQ
ncbi:hypothetical protein E4U43_006431 [Claviceps pusilla]|uniref:Uncharacterized protein n=1 Tax=Claviceps pusilla TaxID=123648 RepID=A0A9P7N2E9_9HYPO|nr:hypothetical protein E4U43_006431 [Claviceps pusilla]